MKAKVQTLSGGAGITVSISWFHRGSFIGAFLLTGLAGTAIVSAGFKLAAGELDFKAGIGVLVCCYFFIAYCFNRTKITVTPTQVVKKYGPFLIPWPWMNERFPLEAVSSFAGRTRNTTMSGDDGGSRGTAHEIHAGGGRGVAVGLDIDFPVILGKTGTLAEAKSIADALNAYKDQVRGQASR